MQRPCLWMYPDLSRLRLLGRLIQNISGLSRLWSFILFFIPPLVPVSPPWQMQVGRLVSAWGGYKLPTYAMQLLHRVPAIRMAPLVGSLALLITSTPVKRLDSCCSEAVNLSPWRVSFTIMWIIYFRIFSFKGPDSPTDKWAAGLCRK